MEEKKKILLVDDDRNMLHLLRAFLKDTYQVATADNGKDALVQLQKEKADLVLLDCMMPGMDGKETLERIRADEALRDLPVYFLTGVSDTEKISECLQLKPVGCILKPIGKNSLLTKLRSYFEEEGYQS